MNHFYQNDKCVKGTIYLRCSDRSCRGRAIQKGDFFRESRPHNCNIQKEANKFLATKMVKEIGESLKETSEAVPQAVQQVLTSMGPESLQIFKKSNIERRIHRFIREHRWNPADEYNITVPPYLCILNDENVLKFNFFSGDKQVLGFSTDEQMRLLATSSTISSDGTFSITPKPFIQLYIIHGFKDGYRFPCCFFY